VPARAPGEREPTLSNRLRRRALPALLLAFPLATPLAALAVAPLILAVPRAAAPLAAQAAPPVLTLDEAIRLSLRAAPAAVAAGVAVDGAGADVLASRGAWLPSVGVTSFYANSSNQRFDQASGQLVSESYTAQITGGYDLFTGGRRVGQQRAAAARLRTATANERAQRFQTMLATTEVFYGAAAAAELLGAAEQRLERARKQLDFARTRLEVGTATRSDLLRAELEVGNAELVVLDAGTALRSARLQLGRQVGADGEVRPAAESLPARAPELPPVDLLLARAAGQAPAVIAARSVVAESRADRWQAYGGYLPSLRVTGGYDWFSFSFPPDQQSWSMRLIASYPLFNNFQREATVARVRAAERLAAARERDAELAVRAAVEDAAGAVTSGERRVEIAERTVELAREDLRVLEERYQLGAATILDLQTSQVALADAEITRVRARQALGVSIARLEAVLGEEL
jgi:outer membrane protein